MADEAAALAPAAKVERTQAAARLRVGAWNKSHRAALLDNVEAARDGGAAHLFADYSGLKFRYDFFPVQKGGAKLPDADVVMQVGINDVQMSEGQPNARMEGQALHLSELRSVQSQPT